MAEAFEKPRTRSINEEENPSANPHLSVQVKAVVCGGHDDTCSVQVQHTGNHCKDTGESMCVF